MPELPEVETVCRGLSKALSGRRIEAIKINRKDLRIPFPARLAEMAGARVESIGRRAKYILIRLNNDETMIVHLGMSGRMVIKSREDAYIPEKHDHLLMKMQDGTQVVFNDARRFGLVDLVASDALDQHRLFQHLGPEPLEKAFSADYLAQKLKDKKVAIKLAIMDQTVVVGVGNIYASEALFRAGINPKRRAKTLKKPEIAKLIESIRKVLQDAIKAGGSSLRDYVQADGELGYFQHHWAVYDKQGLKCPGCTCDIKKTGGIKKFTQGARSTFYCPQKQK